MLYCALVCGKGDEMIKWGSGSDWWGRERLIGTTLDEEASLFEEESRAAFGIVENLYKEWTSRFGLIRDRA